MIHRNSHSATRRIFTGAATAVAALSVAFAANAQPATAPTTSPTTRPMGEYTHEHAAEHMEQMKQFHGINKAIAVLHGTEGSNVTGTVKFMQSGKQVKIVADVDGLEPNSTHGFHLHEYGDCSAPDGKSAGGHYNPEEHQHGLPGTQPRHAGDLGNLKADANGHAHYEITVDNLTISGMVNPIIGRGVIVHAKEDDGGQPTGNAGARLACGVIGVAKDSGKKSEKQ